MASGRDSSDSYDVPLNFDQLNLSDCTGGRRKYRRPLRLAFSANNSLYSSAPSDDSSASCIDSDTSIIKKQRRKTGFVGKLPPLGVFWDIENVRVPKMKSAAAVVQRIREVFLENYRESEFVVVCDVKKEPAQLIQELHDSQVNLVHVSSISKNAADEKLRQSLRRFADLHPAPAAVILISGDVNFAADLSDLRYRKKLRVILIHNVNVADALILCANEHHSFTALTENLPKSLLKKPAEINSYFSITILNIPRHADYGKVKNRLNYLTNNCGGKCTEISTEEGTASVRFGNFDLALRAQKRIQGENVFGQKIKVLPPSVRNYSGQKVKNADNRTSQQSQIGYQQQFGNVVPPPPGFHNRPYPYNYVAAGRKPHQDNLLNIAAAKFGSLAKMGPQCVSPMEVNNEQYQNSFTNRKPPTSRQGMNQEQLNMGLGACALPYGRVRSISGTSEYSDNDGKGYTLTDFAVKSQASQPVDLTITNLDPLIDTKELRRLLTNMVKEFAMIISLTVTMQTDGAPIANLRVNSQQEAQFIISQLHRQKLGRKRIVISYEQQHSPDPEQLKAMVVSVLQEAPDKRMPLFKFMELLESRYLCAVSICEVNKLKDVAKISDERGARVIALTDEALRINPFQNISQTMVPHCVIHCPKNMQNIGWCELNCSSIPNIMMSLSMFAAKLITLLNIHFGCMPLLSFQTCYEQVFQESLPVQEHGVPLEHLVTCVPNVEIKLVGPNKSIKVVKHEIKRNEESNEDQVLKSVAPPLAPGVAMLCREVVDLLKNMDRCQILLTKFIPAYHHHFGRQCRVADYGYTKLLDLFEAISHVVQIMGDGHRRVITLTHTAQMRRFTSDLLRVLKVQPNKQVAVHEYALAYERVLNKPFNPVEYGLCNLDDLLCEMPENTVAITREEEGVCISVPKREQTPEEMARTKQFANEIKELSDGERTVSLTPRQSLKILSSQVLQVIRAAGSGNLTLNDLPILYFREFGYPLNPGAYQCETLEEVVDKLSEYVQVVHSNAGSLLREVEMDTSPNILRVRCWALLLCPPHVKDLASFRYEYRQCYQNTFTLESLKNISNVVSLSSTSNTDMISLTSLYVLAAQLYYVICSNNESVEFNRLEHLYEQYYNKPLKMSSFNINSVNEFYNRFNLMFYIRGSKKKSVVVLNKNLKEHLPFRYDNNNVEKEVESRWGPILPSSSESEVDTMRKYSPPKPDTPPTPGTTLWWSSPSKFDPPSVDFCINMPITLDPTLFGKMDNLISPAKQLLAIDNNPWTSSQFLAPEPHELPLPSKLIPKAGVSDDSGDSGVNIMLENSPSDSELQPASSEKTGAIKKMPLYGTFLNFK